MERSADMDLEQQSFEKASLVLRHLQGELNPQEEEIVAAWLAEAEGNRRFLEKIKDEQQISQELEFFASLDTAKAWQKVARQTTAPPKVRNLWHSLEGWKYAAAVLVLVAAAISLVQAFYPINKDAGLAQKTEMRQAGPDPALDIRSGGNKARLTLADGSVIMLQEVANGTLQEQNGVKILKQDGRLTYQFSAKAGKGAVAYNTIATPVGGQYMVVLPDGSKVWLNSASSLRFPTFFAGKARSVDLHGEAYFEVAQNKKNPFRVKAGATTVEVLGTHFNVMAYPDEHAANTTLLEGSVKVSHGVASRILVPGQQAQISRGIKLVAVDVAEAVAWKNGLFQFNNTDLGSIMRQLQRWYGIEVAYVDEVQSQHFTGLISRNTALSQVLKMLEVSGDIRFDLRDRKVTVSRPGSFRKKTAN
jgi:ferric-dicitrate binding protein FerR (iron transport regulator)